MTSLPSPLNSGGATTPPSVISQLPQLPPPFADTSSSPSPSTSSSTSIILVVIIIASAVIVSVCIYLILQFITRRFHRSIRTFSAASDDVVNRSNTQQYQTASSDHKLLDSLPLFKFSSVSGNLTGGDCAVCLSKFEPHDELRLLPLCCHAFHAECIDAWIVSNQTCPLCRSIVFPSESDLLDKILPSENRGIGNDSFRDGNSGSFRIEIGSISRRRGGALADAAAAEGVRRSYSIGSFEYILDENGYEIPILSTTHHRGISDCPSIDKESSIGIPIPEPPAEALAAEVGSGRNWLREYVDRLASSSRSFRSSGRFFTGSSRRTDSIAASAATEDLEANRVGEEISELFRWLSGI